VRRNLVLASLVLGLAAVALWPAEARAQRHAQPRVSHAVPHRSYYRPYYYRPYSYWPYYRPYYYRPYYYGAFYSPFYWGVYGWYGGYPYPYGPFPPYGYYAGAYDPASSVRVLVTPKEAQVYVDGYFVGLVDDFDGWSQRLRLVPGEHEIAFYLEGYRTVHERLLFRPGASYKLRHRLEKLAPGEPNPPRPEPEPGPARDTPRPPAGEPPAGYHPAAPPEDDSAAPEAEDFGTLAIRVQPADAVVQIDGERWDSPLGGSRLQVQLSQGTHRVAITKEGFRPYSTEVQVRAGEVTTLNVSLPEE
jgi:PEGA domain